MTRRGLVILWAVLVAAPAAAETQAVIAARANRDGVALLSTKHYNEASAKFRDAVSRVPESVYFTNLCESLDGEGKYSEALTACNASLKQSPSPELVARTNALIDHIKAEARAQKIELAP